MGATKKELLQLLSGSNRNRRCNGDPAVNKSPSSRACSISRASAIRWICSALRARSNSVASSSNHPLPKAGTAPRPIQSTTIAENIVFMGVFRKSIAVIVYESHIADAVSSLSGQLRMAVYQSGKIFEILRRHVLGIPILSRYIESRYPIVLQIHLICMLCHSRLSRCCHKSFTRR